MSTPQFTYLDLETKYTATDVGGWVPAKLGLSVAVVVTGCTLRIFKEKEIDKLVHVLQTAKCVVGYNLKNFDFGVLEGYKTDLINQVTCFDMMEDLGRIAGRRIRFSSVERATLGLTRELDGLHMVKAWKTGDLVGLIEGCCNDVLAFKAVHEYGMENGEVLYYPNEAKRRRRIPVQWCHDRIP